MDGDNHSSLVEERHTYVQAIKQRQRLTVQPRDSTSHGSLSCVVGVAMPPLQAIDMSLSLSSSAMPFDVRRACSYHLAIGISALYTKIPRSLPPQNYKSSDKDITRFRPSDHKNLRQLSEEDFAVMERGSRDQTTRVQDKTKAYCTIDILRNPSSYRVALQIYNQY